MSSSNLAKGRQEEKIAEWKPLYDEGAAMAEAHRCLYCEDAPCINACPTDIDIPTFIHKISTGNIKGAARTIIGDNILGYSCARVCPVEVLCVGDCVFNHMNQPPIQIGRLQRYATEALLNDVGLKGVLKEAKAKNGKKVACVGAGPASLAAAALLTQAGVEVTLFEKRDVAGGLNTWGIAPYKMHAQDALREIGWIEDLGVNIKTGMSVTADEDGDGKISAKTLLSDFDGVFLGIGIGDDSSLDIDGEKGPGVHGATELIEKIKLDPDLHFDGVNTAIVVGAGNTAIDIAHELALLGIDDVIMVYRRTEARMSGYKHEMSAARKDRVRLLENRQPLAVEREGHALVGLRVSEAKDGKAIAGTEHVIKADLVVMAIGQNKDTGIAKAFSGVETDEKGRVVVDEHNHRTGNHIVWAGGDCVNGGKEVVNAVAHAKLAVADMLEQFGAA
jgi:glutamate synthase (NADPH/NADH) small chain